MPRAMVGVWLLLAACGGFGTVRSVGDRKVGVSDHAIGPVRLVSFVNVKDSVVDADAGAGFAMVLPGGDWLATVNGSLVRLSPDGTSVRWTRTGLDVWDAVAGAEGRVVAVGTIADPEALNGAARSLFALDTATGALVWRTEADPIVRGASASLARVGTTTVAASAYGEAAVDDRGTVVWVASRDHADEPLIAPATGGVVVAWAPDRMAQDFLGGPPLHHPLLVRTLDIATGEERGRFELAADNDFYALGQLGFSGDGRTVLQASDVRVKVEARVGPDGRPSTSQSASVTARLVVIDAGDLARPSARAIAMPADQPGAMPAALAPSEVVFVDRYATNGDALALRIVDLAGSRTRRVPLLQTAKDYTFVQFTQLSVRPDQITFAGLFSGHAPPLAARVEAVDKCDAQHGVECFGPGGTVTLAPAAGVIGTVAFPRSPAP